MKILRYKKQALLLAVLLLPALFILLSIVHYGVNTPFWDDWEMVPLFQKVDHGSLSFGDLWAQHNEHRILFPNIVLLTSAYITHWNLHSELLISFAFSLLSLLLLYRMARSRFRNFGFTVLSVAFLSLWFYSPIQWQNWLWGWQVEWFMCVAGVIGTIYILDRLGQSPAHKTMLLATAICTAVITTFSLGSGILIWPLGLGLLLLQKQGRKRIVAWIVSACTAAALYYYHYQKPAGSPPLTTFLHKPVDFVQYFLILIGRPIGGSVDTSMLMGGLFVLALVPIACLIWVQRKQIYRFIPWISLIVFSLMVDLVTALSRVGFGVAQSTNSRYTAISLLFLIGFTLTILALLDNQKMAYTSNVLAWLCVIAIGLPLIFSSYKSGVEGFRARSAYLQFVAMCTHRPNPTDSCLRYTYPIPYVARERLSYLKQKHWAHY